MLDFIHQAKALTEEVTYPYEFSVCTLVTRKEEYGEMMGSFVSRGFTHDCCEYLYIDNSEGCTQTQRPYEADVIGLDAFV